MTNNEDSLKQAGAEKKPEAFGVIGNTLTGKPKKKTSISEKFTEHDERLDRQETLIFTVLLIVGLTGISTLIDLFSFKLQVEESISKKYLSAEKTYEEGTTTIQEKIEKHPKSSTTMKPSLWFPQ